MNRFYSRHLDEGELLQYVDHELSRRRQASARDHVHTCWKCQSQMSDLQTAIAEYMHYQERIAELDAEQDTGEWPDLRQRIDREREDRVRPALSFAKMARYAYAALATAALGLAGVLATRWVRPVPPPPPAPPTISRPHVTERGGPVVEPPPAVPNVKPVPRAATESPSPRATVQLELAAVAALHRLSADLGEPIQVETGADGQVALVGRGLSPQRQQEIAAALAQVREVGLRFEQPVPSAPAPPGGVEFTARPAPLHAALERLLGGRSAAEALTNSLLDESEEMMARAHALHNLQARFPVARQDELDEQGRATLRQIEADHRAAWRNHVAHILQLLRPVRKGLGPGDGSGVPAESADLFASSRRLDHALNIAFAGAATDWGVPRILAELDASLREMEKQ
jgi:hypothetical protein